MMIPPPARVDRAGISFNRKNASTMPYTGSSPVITEAVWARIFLRELMNKVWDRAVHTTPRKTRAGRSETVTNSLGRIRMTGITRHSAANRF